MVPMSPSFCVLLDNRVGRWNAGPAAEQSKKYYEVPGGLRYRNPISAGVKNIAEKMWSCGLVVLK